MILRAAGMVDPGRAVVLGGGACEEIPLAALLERFESVTLNDFEEPQVRQAVEAVPHGSAGRAKLEVRIADLTGITEAALAEMAGQLALVADPQAAIRAMADVLDHVQPGPMPIAGRFDLVVCSCVLSQLHVALSHQAAQLFAAKYPAGRDLLAQSDISKMSLESVARRMEDRFIANLATLVTDTGLVYLSESAQVCFLQLAADGQWQTPGTYRMLRTKDLADYVRGQFDVVGRARWEWVVDAPQSASDVGRLFDVQSLVLRRSANTSAGAMP